MGRPKLEDANPTGVLAELRPNGHRKISLTKKERAQLQLQRQCEAAAALFLDLETDRTYAQIAEELGLTVARLKDLTKKPEFDAAYNQLFAELGHDPRFRAAQGALADMLPAAIRQLKALLNGTQTPAGVRLKAIEQVMKLNGLQEPQPQTTDRQELARFLVEHHVRLDSVGR
jgi:predicted transcriptional regulator